MTVVTLERLQLCDAVCFPLFVIATCLILRFATFASLRLGPLPQNEI